MDCRPGCAACCIAPSISSALPGMPRGKPAGARCANLREDGRCSIWGSADYPSVCRAFRPGPSVCGRTAAEALELIGRLERATRPGSSGEK